MNQAILRDAIRGLCGPINNVLGQSVLLLSTNVTAGQRAHGQSIRESCEVLLPAVNSLRDLLEMEAGELALENAPVDPAAIVRDVVEMLTPAALRKSVSLTAQCSMGGPLGVAGDPARLTQILALLVAMAIRSTKTTQVIIQLNTARDDEDSVRLRVLISDGHTNQADDVYAEARECLARVPTGESLADVSRSVALLLCDGLLGLMGGSLALGLGPDGGSAFRIDLTLARQPEGASTDRRTARAMLLSGVKVLLTDDNAINREVACAILQGSGAQVDAASGGAQAIEMLGQHTYDVVLMDIEMPGMNGYQAIDLIRKSSNDNLRRVPILALTAHVTSGYSDRIISAGADGFIGKPFEPEHLVGEILRQVHPDIAKPADPSQAIADSTADEFPVIDWARFHRATANIPERGCRIARVFMETMPGDMERLRSVVAAGDWDAVHVEAHGMKGACRTLGAAQLGAIMDRIDSLTGVARRTIAGDLIMAAERQWQVLHEALLTYLAEHEERNHAALSAQ
jgi:CheY-like chemotaxis protein